MIYRPKIACFLTAGYTEVNALKGFFRKINANVDYIQLCPAAQRRSKDSIRRRHVDSICTSQSGMTGDDLIDFAVGFIKKDAFLREEYSAIIIEDDKDDRFLKASDDGYGSIDLDSWFAFKEKVENSITSITSIPVLILMAAPEVESWFYADYANGFGYVYMDELGSERGNTFSVRFKNYIKSRILTYRYADDIEAYGIKNGSYSKLSVEIQEALESIDFADYLNFETGLKYSKRDEGERMLNAINPDVVKDVCTVFFAPFYWALKELDFS